MTRGSLPPFDLYAELEVSRQATPAVIEAAHRALVKRHHPDVSADADNERIARLNIARDWLLDPARRARYDGGPALEAATARRAVRRERRGGSEDATRPPRPSSEASFGVHSRDVRQFLAELRDLDGARAARIVEARAAVDVAAYTDARNASLAAARPERSEAWGFARDAASVIAKGKVADPATGAIVASVAADIAGGIVVRDLLPAAQLEVLREPWTRSAPALAGVPVKGGRQARPLGADSPARPERLAPAPIAAAGTWASTNRTRMLALVAAGLAVLVAIAVFAGGRKPESAVAGLTSGPSTGAVVPGVTAVATGLVVAPGSFDLTATPAGETNSPGSTAVPGPTPYVPGRTRAPVTATATPRESPTARPTTIPTPLPTSTPATPTPPSTPRPSPTPSPPLTCAVVDLVGVNTSNAQLTWNTAGFTGTVVFSPAPPPQYKIGWQSLGVGTHVPCTSNITVQPTAP